jgi:prepilin-type processing-associated H-X9-DG protein
MSSKTAFTKKDIIVVVLCGIFLLATLGSVGVSGRRRAKEAVCLSNLRQWGPVFLAFAADNDGYFMAGWYPCQPSVQNTDIWMEALRPYYGNDHNLRCCPEAVIPGTDELIGGGPYGGNGTFVGWGVFPGECGQPSSAWPVATACDYGSYGINGWLCNPPASCPVFQSHNIAKNNWRTVNVPGGENIPLLTGAQWIDAWPDATDQVPEYDGEPWGPYSDYSHMVRVCMSRHNGFVNTVFLDGSARKVGLKCLWKLQWHRHYDFDCTPTEAEFNSAGDGWMAEFPPCE